MSTPAGWHPSPDRPGFLRYWDGEQWTEHYHEQDQAPPQAAAGPVLGDSTAETLWEAKGKPITGIGAGRYRLTPHYLYFERGTLSTDSQQVPVSHLLDVDVKQSMAQKARSVGTVLVKINRGAHVEMVQIVDVPNFREGQAAITKASHEARAELQRAQNTMRYEHHGAPPAAATPAPVAAAAPDYVGQLEQLGRLRDTGVLTDEEFSTKKAEILARL